MLDVRRMQVLRSVISSGSVTAAAANLGYTPSAVSQQIAALEKQAGTALLERTGRGVRATAAGRLLSEHAEVLSRNVAAAETALADLREGRTGHLSIRYFTSAGAALVAPALARLRGAHPGVRIDLELVDDPALSLSEVERGRADLALIVGAPGRPREGVLTQRLGDDAYAAVLPAGHPLADRREIALADLAAESWIASERPGPCLDPLLDACAAAGFAPDFGVRSEDHVTAQGFVAAGLGVGVMPHLGLVNRHPDVVVRDIGRPRPFRAVHAVARQTSLAQPALAELLDALSEFA
ncbi:LysR family transcriptional regulator [Streptomyces sp. AJS327]|uniref:LysR family transcriptional regulator n=1 Tax=Streptomyces sp. AJS327 TaxID=2545265 RepID=UPI0015DE2191|nr:LysR family transcriptional regulator [Streptomyces sp. AJS327]MBA0053693.1 LysR family transcriptional regulator [Streptomyces sp. AJS327]